jgi:hypothetical protein
LSVQTLQPSADAQRGYGSILVGAHDGEHARRLRGIGGIFGAALQVGGVVYLEKPPPVLKRDRAEVVLAMRSPSFVKLLNEPPGQGGRRRPARAAGTDTHLGGPSEELRVDHCAGSQNFLRPHRPERGLDPDAASFTTSSTRARPAPTRSPFCRQESTTCPGCERHDNSRITGSCRRPRIRVHLEKHSGQYRCGSGDKGSCGWTRSFVKPGSVSN